MTKNKSTGMYEQTATVSGDFNLHVECSSYPYRLELLQKTAGTQYVPCHGWRDVVCAIDVDCVCKISPKKIKVVCDKDATVTITE